MKGRGKKGESVCVGRVSEKTRQHRVRVMHQHFDFGVSVAATETVRSPGPIIA